MQAVQLKGITWDHSRGFLPMVATAQRFTEHHPHVHIEWRTRSLENLLQSSVAELSKEFDLIVLSHSCVGEAVDLNLLVPLSDTVPKAFIDDQSQNSVGLSHASYRLKDKQWALAVDAGASVSAARLDVLAKYHFGIPKTWDEMLELARAGLVALPAWKINCLAFWSSLCINEGQAPFTKIKKIVDHEVGVRALQALKELTDLCGSSCLNQSSIAAYEKLIGNESYAYSPFVYGYSNYARKSYTDMPLWFGGLVTRKHHKLVSSLAGAGLAVSSKSKNIETAINYAQFVASGEIQKGLYTSSGGQAAHRSAWMDEDNNFACNDFYANTLATLDNAYVRPRYANFTKFQSLASDKVHRYLQGAAGIRETMQTLNELDKIYRKGEINIQPLNEVHKPLGLPKKMHSDRALDAYANMQASLEYQSMYEKSLEYRKSL